MNAAASPGAPIRLLVVDDHTLFRRGLTALLARDPGLQVVGDAADAGEAQRKAQALQPEVILLDIHLPGVTGIDAIASLQAACPACKVLMLTVSEDADDLAAALRAGAAGYLLKTIEGDALSAAIRRVVAGEAVVAQELTAHLVAAMRLGTGGTAAAPVAPPDPLAALSPREREILGAIGRSASNKEIAREFNIAESTVKVHVQHLLRKLDASSRVQLAVIANSQSLL
jgi:two-component system, NarL family, nitrate/nitrite response regulator NarL